MSILFKANIFKTDVNYVNVPSILVTTPNVAIISFGQDALSYYPGEFIQNNGFLSEPDIRLQDSKLYQPFAYLTNTELDIEEFFTTVKKLVHPAGQNLFNNRLIENELNLLSNVSITSTSNIFFEALDVINIVENKITTFNKVVEDGESFVELSDGIDNINVNKVLDEIININELESKTLQKLIDNNETIANVVENLSLSFNTSFEEQQTINDEEIKTLEKTINNNETFATITDNFSASFFSNINSYFNEDYVLDVYTGEFSPII